MRYCAADASLRSAGSTGSFAPRVNWKQCEPTCRGTFFYVTPGVRPAGHDGDDHRRVHTYSDALRAGSRLLVVGRTVLGSADPRTALRALHNEIQLEA